jgi:Fe-S cluster biogenesis protein NfuA
LLLQTGYCDCKLKKYDKRRNNSLVEIIDDKHVKVRLEGACTSCSLSISTMKAGVETTIKKYVPQIETVENVA